MNVVPIKRGTARRLGLDLPPDTVIYDEIDWGRWGVSMQDIELSAWQRSALEQFGGRFEGSK